MNISQRYVSKICLISLLLVMCLATGINAQDYIINSGDKLRISVWGQNELSGEFTVRPDGKISFQYIGEVKAASLTPLELRKIMTERLSEFIKDPQVTINLVESDQVVVYVFGNLKKAGDLKLKGNTNLLQFLSMLGTLPDNVDLKTSFMVRDNKRLTVDLYKLLNQGDLSQNIVMKSGDTIFFKDKPKAEVVQEVEPEKIKKVIRIVGEVKQEKTIPYEPGLTVLEAILRAGGFTPYARPSGTKVVRRRGDKVEEIVVDMEAVRDGAIDRDIPLEPGDLISVPATLF